MYKLCTVIKWYMEPIVPYQQWNEANYFFNKKQKKNRKGIFQKKKNCRDQNPTKPYMQGSFAYFSQNLITWCVNDIYLRNLSMNGIVLLKINSVKIIQDNRLIHFYLHWDSINFVHSTLNLKHAFKRLQPIKFSYQYYLITFTYNPMNK